MKRYVSISYFNLRHGLTVRELGAHLLARITAHRVLQPIEILANGSYLAKRYRTSADQRRDRNGLVVRIIEYTLNDPTRPGTGQRHRLLTTLLDAELDEELTLDELKTHQRERPVLHSQTPAGVVQEAYGLLLAHDLVRVLMHEAAATRQLDPRRVSFTAALKILRSRLPECPPSQRGCQRWYRRLAQEVAEERSRTPGPDPSYVAREAPVRRPPGFSLS